MSHLRTDNRGVVVACASCGQNNRLLFDRLGEVTRCGRCQAALPAPVSPVDVGSTADFDALVQRSRLPVLVDFWAAWCGPCRVVGPQVEIVAKRNSGRWLVAKVDTEAVSDLASRMNIRSIPTLAVFWRGKEAARTAGAMSADEIERFVGAAVT
jgi:thioredoxin 2